MRERKCGTRKSSEARFKCEHMLISTQKLKKKKKIHCVLFVRIMGRVDEEANFRFSDWSLILLFPLWPV